MYKAAIITTWRDSSIRELFKQRDDMRVKSLVSICLQEICTKWKERIRLGAGSFLALGEQNYSKVIKKCQGNGFYILSWHCIYLLDTLIQERTLEPAHEFFLLCANRP